jgi:uncharacterized protein with PIN domain
MILDTSLLIAILAKEPDSERAVDAISAALPHVRRKLPRTPDRHRGPIRR